MQEEVLLRSGSFLDTNIYDLDILNAQLKPFNKQLVRPNNAALFDVYRKSKLVFKSAYRTLLTLAINIKQCSIIWTHLLFIEWF